MTIWKTRPFLCTGHYNAFVIVRQQSQCFDALINIQKDADERKLTQAGQTNTAIYAPNLQYVLCT